MIGNGLLAVSGGKLWKICSPAMYAQHERPGSLPVDSFHIMHVQERAGFYFYAFYSDNDIVEKWENDFKE
jgi:hypothetical protein